MKKIVLMIVPALICGLMLTSCSSEIATDDHTDLELKDDEIVKDDDSFNGEDDGNDGGELDGQGELWMGQYIVTWEELRGTQWKLYSIDHNERGRIELEPKDCDTCYTFTFDKDETGWFFSGVSILNTVTIKMNYPKIEVLVTGSDEPFDGNLFCSALRLVEIIDCDGRFFGLHFNDCGGFLLGHGNCNGVILLKRVAP